jgi:hypothetical protein
VVLINYPFKIMLLQLNKWIWVETTAMTQGFKLIKIKIKIKIKITIKI